MVLHIENHSWMNPAGPQLSKWIEKVYHILFVIKIMILVYMFLGL